jgi:hypothetical protein
MGSALVRILYVFGPLRTSYSTAIILSRVYLGTRIPGDELVGSLLGIAVQLVLNRDYTHRAIAPILALEKSRPNDFNAVLFHPARNGYGVYESSEHWPIPFLSPSLRIGA